MRQMKGLLFCVALFFLVSVSAVEVDFTKVEIVTVQHNFSSELEEAKSHFPELEHVRIVLVGESFVGGMMKARPKFRTLFGPRENRVYEIVINNHYRNNGGLLFDSVPEDARIGLFGHEIAHIKDYHNRNFLEMVSFGLEYVIKSEKRRIERETDRVTIEHGLGKELYAFNRFVLEHEDSPYRYKKVRQTYYLSPEEILNYSA